MPKCGECGLTPAHHLRGAAQNVELFAKVGQLSPQRKARTAPRLVHALVRQRLSTWGSAGRPNESEELRWSVDPQAGTGETRRISCDDRGSRCVAGGLMQDSVLVVLESKVYGVGQDGPTDGGYIEQAQKRIDMTPCRGWTCGFRREVEDRGDGRGAKDAIKFLLGHQIEQGRCRGRMRVPGEQHV